MTAAPPSVQDPQTGHFGEQLFLQEVEWELARASRGGPGARGAGGGCLAYLELDELPQRREQFGAQVVGEIARQVAALLQADARRLEIAGRDAEGRFGLLMPEQSADAARRRLEQLSRCVAAHRFTAGGERVRVTLSIGCVPFSPEAGAEQLRQQALAALDSARTRLDLHPVPFGHSLSALAAHGEAAARGGGRFRMALRKSARTPFQVLQRKAYGAIGLCLLALPLAALRPSRYGAKTQTATPPWNVRLPSTPSQTAMREAAVWWSEAVQLACDETDEAREELQTWDPDAPFDAHEAHGERQRFLAADHGGYVERALAAVHRAERLARSPVERERADRFRRRWETATRPAAHRT